MNLAFHHKNRGRDCVYYAWHSKRIAQKAARQYDGINVGEIKMKHWTRSLRTLVSIVALLSFGLSIETAAFETEVGTIFPNIPVANEQYGSMTAVDGDFLAVTAPAENDSSGQRVVYVFRKSVSGWVQDAKLTPPASASAVALFGSAIDISGDTLVIGASKDDEGNTSNGQGAGAVFVYTRNSGVWTLQQKLVPSGDVIGGIRFGESVAIDSEHLLIGAPGVAFNSTYWDTGAFYPYQFDGSSWVDRPRVQFLDFTSRAARFGRNIAIDGTTAVIQGLFGLNLISGEQGVSLVYEFDGNSWLRADVLEASDSNDNWELGEGAHISGDRIVVLGRKRVTGDPPPSTAAYVFDRTTSGWIEIQKLLPDGSELVESLLTPFVNIFDVSLYKSTILIGGEVAGFNSYIGQSYGGGAFVFDLDNDSWAQTRFLRASNETSGNYSSGFGRKVEITASNVFVSAAGDDTRAVDGGAVYLFDGPSPVAQDSDGDGMSDSAELLYGFDPENADDAGLDPDEDFLANVDEIANRTNPFLPDSDADQTSDGLEVGAGLDPGDNSSRYSGPISVPRILEAVSYDGAIKLSLAPSRVADLAGIVRYDLLAGSSEQAISVSVPAAKEIETSYVLSGLATDTEYEISVTATDLFGMVSPSASVNVRTAKTAANGIEWANQFPHPVLFVHGYRANDTYWQDVVDELRQVGWTRQRLTTNDNGGIIDREGGPVRRHDIYTLSFKSDNNSNLCLQAVQLADYIQAIKSSTGADKVVIVGHSQGGIVARTYIQVGANLSQFLSQFPKTAPEPHETACIEALESASPTYSYGDDVAKLVTYGSPHTGVHGFVGAYPLLRSGGEFLTALNTFDVFPFPRNVELVNGIGRLGSNGPDDCLVDVESQSMAGLPGFVEPDRFSLFVRNFTRHSRSPLCPGILAVRTEPRDEYGIIALGLGGPFFHGSVGSPVELAVTAPDGKILSKERREIWGARYEQVIDASGSKKTFFSIPFPADGDYQLTIIPDDNASPEATFSLQVSRNGEVNVLATGESIGSSGSSINYFVELDINPDDDGDGILDDDDNCPAVSNANQEDFDGDGIGDVCDKDIDGDGVTNDVDLCPKTSIGSESDPNIGCSIGQLCPCENPKGILEGWRNHGQYVSCVARVANTFVGMSLISDAEKDAQVSAAGNSTCGLQR